MTSKLFYLSLVFKIVIAFLINPANAQETTTGVPYNLLVGPFPSGMKGEGPTMKCFAVAPRKVCHLIGNGPDSAFTGTGYVDNMFLGLLNASPGTLKNSTIQIYLDGSTTPTIDENLQLFFCQYMREITQGATMSPIFNSTADGSLGITLSSKMAIPFKKGIAIDLTNGDPDHGYQLYSMASYNLVPITSIPKTQKLYSSTFENDSCTPYSNQVLLDQAVSGPGQLGGLFMAIDGSKASDPGHPMEGKLRIFIDGSTTPSYESSGTEDICSMGFYFSGYPDSKLGDLNNRSVCDLDKGLVYKDSSRGIYMFYRLWMRDPIAYSSHIKITWDAGESHLDGGLDYTGSCKIVSTVWYYDEQ